ncbi:DNA-directed RNA polymerases II, IV and V subunit 3-like [Pyrus ussuriensis x Pyrus communis]|uniref:DNA-directed RNA polymerases II, IV and V subunit 3-like n=1 Tax=Pyrus ussuriensis x Pyrus communis TaxID=2448454 RepID=A0A5N5FEX6_9ROSA|nr:DNA-directed RNA polymerases II, IV and V subunit 3-like [Pyrus ussuriensis x Pyrus communis]
MTFIVLRFRTFMALKNAIRGVIHKPKLPNSFCFLDHFIIIGVYFGINYHDNVKHLGMTRGRRLFIHLIIGFIHEVAVTVSNHFRKIFC